MTLPCPPAIQRPDPDARYAAALAHVGICVTAAEAAHVDTLTLLADLRRPRCACCGQRFTPTARRQINCHTPACDRKRWARDMKRYRQHLAMTAPERRGLGRDLVCVCGGALRVEVQPGGATGDRCLRCGALTLTRRRAA